VQVATADVAVQVKTAVAEDMDTLTVAELSARVGSVASTAELFEDVSLLSSLSALFEDVSLHITVTVAEYS
jgi:hypothetical protein